MAPSSTTGLGSPKGSSGQAHIERWVDRARRRLGLGAGFRATCSAGLWLLPGLTLARFGLLRLAHPVAEPTWMLGLAGLGLAAAFAAGYLSRPTRLASAVQLDQAVGARGTVAAAFELGGRSSVGYVDLVLGSAERHLSNVRLGKALPVPRPQRLGPLGLILAGFLVALVAAPRTEQAPQARSAEIEPEAPLAPVLLSKDDLALLAKRGERLLAMTTSDEGRSRALDYAALVRELEKGTVDQKRALSAIAALEQEVSGTPDRDGRNVPPDQAGAPASQSRQAPESGEAERSQQLKDSAEALRRLAERLAQDTAPPSARELDRIRETLEKTRQQNRRSEARAASEVDQKAERLRDKERRLLAKKESGTLSSEEAAELEQTGRQLEKLERQKHEQGQAASELDRQLAEAMRELAGDRKQASEFLDRAAGGLDKEAKRQLTDEEKRELLEQLRALKERLRQADQPDLADKLRDFERRARGGKPGGEGEGTRQAGSQIERTISPGMGQSPGSGDAPPQGQAAQMGRSTSNEPGTEHDPNWQGEASERLGATTIDKAAAARDSGNGESESDTILTAAEAGFTAGTYEKLYSDYQTVLEEMVSGEKIPRGRRTEVERYFELIRPRED